MRQPLRHKQKNFSPRGLTNPSPNPSPFRSHHHLNRNLKTTTQAATNMWQMEKVMQRELQPRYVLSWVYLPLIVGADKNVARIFPEQRRIRRMESSDEDEDVSDDAEDDGQPKAKRSKLSRGSRPTKARSTESPGPGQSLPSKLKRKQSSAEGDPPTKKSKTSGGPNDDPTRKYCLGKLEEIFSNIFLTFPYFPPEGSVKIEGRDADGLGPNVTRSASDKGFTKTMTELTDEEKAQLEEKARAYATQVEVAVFEAHAEFDKAGSPSAAGKYK